MLLPSFLSQVIKLLFWGPSPDFAGHWQFSRGLLISCVGFGDHGTLLFIQGADLCIAGYSPLCPGCRLPHPPPRCDKKYLPGASPPPAENLALERISELRMTGSLMPHPTLLGICDTFKPNAQLFSVYIFCNSTSLPLRQKLNVLSLHFCLSICSGEFSSQEYIPIPF